MRIFDIILEANVLNVAQPFKELPYRDSIEGYLKTFADNITDKNVAKMFAKKMRKLLVNDERFLAPVRDIPANAPAWAHQAPDIKVFIPTNELNNTVDHLTHYINALVQDSKSNEHQVKVLAQRELADIPKAQSLDVIRQKSQEFFTRGSRKAERSVEGATEVYDAGDGFIWYELTEQIAFNREGKVLQNCIGSAYTRAGCARTGERIYVLKNPKGETVVGMRTKDGVVKEFKGKQNKPPIEKYMVRTIPFLKKIGFDIGGAYSTLRGDLESAGYLVWKNEIYTKEQAKELVKKELLGTVSGTNYKLYKVTGPEPVVRVVYNTPYSIARSRDNADIIHYVATTKTGAPVGLVTVLNKEAINIVRYDKTNESVSFFAYLCEAFKDENVIRSLLRELFSRDLIHSISSGESRKLIWKGRVLYDPSTQDFRDIKEVAQTEFKTKYGIWYVYRGSAVKQLQNAIPSVIWGRGANPIPNMKIDQLFFLDVKSDSFMVFVNNNEIEDAVKIESGAYMRGSEDSMWSILVSEVPSAASSYIPAVIDLVRHFHLRIEPNLAPTFGLMKAKGGYEEIPELELVSNNISIADISELSINQKHDAIQYYERKTFNYQGYQGGRWPGWARPGISKDSVTSFIAIGHEEPVDWMGERRQDRYAAVVVGDTIVTFDAYTKTAPIEVINQINQFADHEGLTIHDKALGRFKTTDTVRIHNNRLISAIEYARITRTTTGEELKFTDGAELREMSDAETRQWQDRKGKLPVGHPYVIIKDNVILGVFTVSKKKVVSNMFVQDARESIESIRERQARRDVPIIPTTKGFPKDILPYVKAIQDKLGFDFSKQQAFGIYPHTQAHDFIRILTRKGGEPMARTAVYRKSGRDPQGMPGWGATNAVDRMLYELGLIDMERVGARYMLNSNEQTEAAYEVLQRGDSISLIDDFDFSVALA